MLLVALGMRYTCSSCFCWNHELVDGFLGTQETRAINTSSAWVLAMPWEAPHDDTGMHDCTFSADF